MLTRQRAVRSSLAVALVLGFTDHAAACRMCDPFLHCITTNAGAQTCVESPPGVCALLLPCIRPGGRIPSLTDDDLTAFSLFDAGAALPGVGRTSMPSSLKREAGAIAVGDEARTLAGPAVHTGALADAALVFGDEYEISFVDQAGD